MKTFTRAVIVFFVGWVVFLTELPGQHIFGWAFDLQLHGGPVVKFLVKGLFIVLGWSLALLSFTLQNTALPGCFSLALMTVLLIVSVLFEKAFTTLVEGLILTLHAYVPIYLLLLVMLLGLLIMLSGLFENRKKYATFVIGVIGMAIFFSIWAPTGPRRLDIIRYAGSFWMTLMILNLTNLKKRIFTP